MAAATRPPVLKQSTARTARALATKAPPDRLLDTNTSIRKHKTVEGCCSDCVKYEQEIARCKQQHDARGVAQWKLERAAHAKEVVALKQRYYGVYTGPCFTCAAWR